MSIRLLVVPYDSGHRGVRMGRGPLHLLEHGLERRLETAGHAVDARIIESPVDPPAETAVAFDLARRLAIEVSDARAAGALPLVLAGNCFTALGTVAGAGVERTAVLWLDAHGDMNTPETTTSGFLDGTAAAALTGRCWSALAATIPGFAPLRDDRLAFLGVRDLDAAEAKLLRESGIRRVDGETVRRHGMEGPAGSLVRGIAGAASQVYLHVDLDVLDRDVARANSYAAPGGLEVDDVLAVAETVTTSGRLAAVAITAFDPAADEDGAARAAAERIISGIVELA